MSLQRARAYIAKLPPAVSGSGGHAATLRAACECVKFGLSEPETWEVMREYNLRCSPRWSDRELGHKIAEAYKLTKLGERVAVQPAPAFVPYSRPPMVKPATAAQLAARSVARGMAPKAPPSSLPKQTITQDDDPFAGEPFSPEDPLPDYITEFLSETNNAVIERVGDRLTIGMTFDGLIKRGHKPACESVGDYARMLATAAIREGRYGADYQFASPAEWLAWATMEASK